MAIVFDFWDRAAARVPVRRRHAPGVGRRRRRDAVPRARRRAARAVPPGRRRPARARDAAERAAHVVPVPAVVRHPVGLPGHRSVPARRRPRAAAARVQRARPDALPVERRRSRADCRTATCSARSCSTASTCSVTDFGTSVTDARGLPRRTSPSSRCSTSSAATPRPIDDDGLDALAAAAKAAQRQLYRTIAGMERRAKIDAGAYVYFTFLRPFAELAGVDLDWTVPRDSLDLYPLLELVDGALPGGVDRGDGRHVLLRRFRDAPAPADERARMRPAARRRVVGGVAARRRERRRRRVSVRLACAPALGVAWWWTHVVAARSSRDRSSCATTRCRCRAGVEVRADGLWGELVCETPFEHWTYGLEAFGVALDDPGDSLRGEIGERMPVGFDLEWEVDPEVGAPRSASDGVRGYEQFGVVHGEVLLGRSRVEIDAAGRAVARVGCRRGGIGAVRRVLDARGTGVATSATSTCCARRPAARFVRRPAEVRRTVTAGRAARVRCAAIRRRRRKLGGRAGSNPSRNGACPDDSSGSTPRQPEASRWTRTTSCARVAGVGLEGDRYATQTGTFSGARGCAVAKSR